MVNLTDFMFVLKVSLISAVGTILGGIIGIVIKYPTKKFLSNIIGFAAGLMLAIVMLDLVPQAVKWNFYGTIIFCSVGIILFLLIESTCKFLGLTSNTYKKVAIFSSIALMVHNLPEGIIIGCSFFTSKNLGIKMAFIIAIHDIPEGIAAVAPMVAANVNRIKILIYTIVIAVPTIIGAVIGLYIGNISYSVLGICLSLAAGIMLYVICGEMIPEANELCKEKVSNLSILIGIILGIIITKML